MFHKQKYFYSNYFVKTRSLDWFIIYSHPKNFKTKSQKSEIIFFNQIQSRKQQTNKWNSNSNLICGWIKKYTKTFHNQIGLNSLQINLFLYQKAYKYVRESFTHQFTNVRVVTTMDCFNIKSATLWMSPRFKTCLTYFI